MRYDRIPPTNPHVVTADASKVSGRDFYRSVFGSDLEKRNNELREQCIRAIRRGDTYGFPPAMVEDCRKQIEAQDALSDITVRQLGGNTWRVEG